MTEITQRQANGSADNRAAGLGIAVMLLGVLLFSLNNATGKWLVSSYSVGQMLFIRSVAAMLIILPFVFMAGWRSIFAVERPWIQFLRVALATMEVFAFYVAVAYMPLADAMTFWLAAPIYVAALSPLVLAERVGWRRWMAIALGFAGVTIALKPSTATLSAPALISILGSLCFGLTLLFGRVLRNTPDVTLIFWQTVATGVAAAALAPVGWTTPTMPDLALMALLGIMAMAALVCFTRSLKLADAATVTPLQYSQLIWGVVFGWLFFGDLPHSATLLGAAVIVLAGLLLLMRDTSSAVASPVEAE